MNCATPFKLRNQLLFALICFVTINAFSQRATTEYDKFSKLTRVETNSQSLINKLGKGLSVKLRSADEANFIIFSGYGDGAGVVGEGDKAVLLLDNDSTVVAFSTSIQSYEVGRYNNTFNHQYSLDKTALDILSTHNVVSVRRYLSDGYVDIEIPKKHHDEIKKLCIVFLKEKAKK